MNRIICIVEGHGEVVALPVLLRRIALERPPYTALDVPRPIRIERDRFLNRREEFERYLRLAGDQSDSEDLVLVLLDADDDCPARLGPHLVERAVNLLPHRRLAVVLANREFEAWFIAAATSLDGTRGLAIGAADPLVDAESRRDAKGWLNHRMREGYGEVIDQPAFATSMNLELAFARCRSFRKLCQELERWLAA